MFFFFLFFALIGAKIVTLAERFHDLTVMLLLVSEEKHLQIVSLYFIEVRTAN